MPGFKVFGINHIGLAPKDAEKARWFFNGVLGLSHQGDEIVAAQKTNTAIFKSSNEKGPRSERLELVMPVEGDGPIQQFLDKRGSGIHHLALTVSNVTAAISHLTSCGVDMIDKSPREGAHNTKIAFVHPRSTGGLLVELVEES
jgi:methylmalonyl-CoA/ethylmalonyl-CoA epimerase